MFTLKFKILVASLLLFGSIGATFYNQITLNSKVNSMIEGSNRVLDLDKKVIDLLTPTATPSPTLVPKITPAAVKSASRSAVPAKVIIKR